MKAIRCILIVLTLAAMMSVSAQSLIEAGPNQTIYCTGSVELNAKTVNGWFLLQQTATQTAIYGVSFPTTETGYAVSSQGGISKTTDGGNTWTNQIVGTTTFYCVHFLSANTGFIGGTGGTLMKTIDGGGIWKPAYFNGITGTTIRSICFTSELNGYAVGTAGYIFKTTDGGGSWTSKVINTSLNFYSVTFPTATTGYAAAIGGAVYVTTDAGANWTLLNTGVTNTLYSTAFVNSTTGFVVGNGGVILKTTDGGVSWTKYAADSVYLRYDTREVVKSIRHSIKSAVFYSVNVVNDSTIYALGTNLATSIFLKTTDAGKTWYEMPSIGGTKILGATFTSQGVGYAVGNSGKILRYVPNKTVTLSYSWYPAIGLSNPYIANPVASPENTTTYTVTGNDGVNLYTDSVVVNVSPINVYSSPFAYIGCEGGVRLDSIYPDYKGKEKLRYKWYPSTGLSCDTILHPIANVDAQTYYYLTAYTSTCSGSASINVMVVPLNVVAAVDKTIIGTGTAQLSTNTNYTGSSRLRYKWSPSLGLSNDTIANPVVSMNCLSGFLQKVYTVTVTTASGCMAQSNVIVNATAFKANAGFDNIIVCGTPLQLLATSNYTGPGTVRCKWTPSIGLSNDTVANPVVTVNTSTAYTVTMTSPGGNVSSDQVIVNVSPVTINAGRDTTVVCGGKVPLTGFSTNYSGTGSLRYKWTPSTGLSNDTIVSPLASPLGTTIYRLVVTTPTGCTATDSVKVVVNSLTLNAGADVTGNCGAQVQLGPVTTNYTGTLALKYKWTPAAGLSNDTIATPNVTIGENKTYTLSITTPSGCTTSDAVYVSSTQLSKPSIRYVGVNEQNKNVLCWNIPSTISTNTIVCNIYRETNVTNNFVKIGSVNAVPGNINNSTPAIFVDTLSHPDVQSNKYKLTVYDNCGNESAISDYHKTMHLTINKGQNTIWNLIWEPYEGYPVSTYNIYRGTTPTSIQIIGSLSGSNTQFSDYTAPTGYVYYQLEAVSSIAAGVKQLAKSGSAVSYYTSRSNIATNKSGIDGLFNLKDISDRLVITPNPATSSVKLVVDDLNANNMQVSIYNSVGQLVKSEGNVNNAQLIDVSTMSAGLYLLVVKTESFTGLQKLLIQK